MIEKNTQEMIVTAIMVISTSIVVFNNVGQSFQLMTLPFSKTTMMYVGGFALAAGAIWTLYLEKVLRTH